MFARVRVQGSESFDAVMVPDDVIGTDQTTRFVLTVAEDGTVGRKTVTLSGLLPKGLRVIKQGMTADDVIVVKGLQRARPGSKVVIKEEPIRTAQTQAPIAAPAVAEALTVIPQPAAPPPAVLQATVQPAAGKKK